MKLTSKLVTTLALLSSVAFAQTLVTVNGTAITQEEVEKELMTATQGRLNQVPADKQMQFRKQVLEQLVAKELVFSDAKKTGVLKSKAFKDRYAEVIKDVKKEIAIQIWQKREFDKIKISDKDLKKYYNDNKGEFYSKPEAHARHILVDTEPEAKALIVKLKGLTGVALRTKFVELAKAKSKGPTGVKGGDLGYFTAEKMMPEFSKVAFSMPIESISKPVKTVYGFHILYLEDRKDKIMKSFKDVKPMIERRLKLEKAKSVMLNKMKILQKKAKIVPAKSK